MLLLCRTRGSGSVRQKREASSRSVFFSENKVPPGSLYRCLGLILKAGLDSWALIRCLRSHPLLPPKQSMTPAVTYQMVHKMAERGLPFCCFQFCFLLKPSEEMKTSWRDEHRNYLCSNLKCTCSALPVAPSSTHHPPKEQLIWISSTKTILHFHSCNWEMKLVWLEAILILHKLGTEQNL